MLCGYYRTTERLSLTHCSVGQTDRRNDALVGILQRLEGGQQLTVGCDSQTADEKVRERT